MAAQSGPPSMNDKMAEQFLLMANAPAQWQASARSLKGCADLVFGFHLAAVRAVMSGNVGEESFSHLSTGGVFFLLAGLAIENLVKGLLVQRAGVRVDGSTLPGELKGHGIRARLRRLKISLSPEEEKLVRRLEIAVSWAGRYPVPLAAAEMRGTGTITRVVDGDEFSMFYERLNALLSEKKP